ncbi:MAG: hypothetical protein PWQ67_283 [Clostridia bacterium]|jgi:hypothetical protein|nr:hypothetical protein [Clostridia bacterium]MDN5321829.1 hypothetical protein [Clostridia bacterium]
MANNLHWEGVNFLPSLHGYQPKNYTLELNDNDLMNLKNLAYSKILLPRGITDPILKITLASGVCSGISAYTLLKFTKNDKEFNEADLYIAILQARTWCSYFIRQCIKSYFYPVPRVIKDFQFNLNNGSLENLPLFCFLPRLFYFNNIFWAHTVIPYGWREGLTHFYIKICDSNYPGEDKKVLKINKNTGYWYYDKKDSSKWILTINYLGNLTRRGPFLL